MREREQPATESADPGASADEVLIGLVQRARNAEADDRVRLCDQVNQALSALPSTPDPAAAARQVLTLLDDEALHGLVDSRGAECRRAALEAVLAMGFPWALHIEPEDLDYLRRRGVHRPRTNWGWWFAATLIAVLLAVALLVRIPVP